MAGLSEDLSIIYYTANEIPFGFAMATQNQLLKATEGLPIICVSHKFMLFGEKNIQLKLPRATKSIYLQVLAGARAASTRYVAMCEDDILYSPAHFKFRPKDGHWGYNMNSWSLYTWGEPLFTQKPGGRRGLHALICERSMLIEHLEQRFELWPGEINESIFGEPGKYDNQLGTTPHPSEAFYTNPPNIVFSHQTALQFKGLGTRKAVGQIRATEVPYWGRAEELRKYYDLTQTA